MIRNIKVSTAQENGLVQIYGEEIVENGVRFMIGIVKFSGRAIGSLTKECLEPTKHARQNSLDSLINLIEDRYCYGSLVKQKE